MSGNFQRAILLLQQNRPADAKEYFEAALGEDPDDAEIHTYYSLCLSNLEKGKDAIHHAQRAVGLDPEQPLAHYALACAHETLGAMKEAKKAIAEAFRMDPYNVVYISSMASFHARDRDWKATLETAERGLAIDPEDVDCINLRALALDNLGQRDAAGELIDAALAKDPHNAHSHANRGWQLLRAGEHRDAEAAFLEALRIDPDLEWARLGILESLKARNVFYRQMQRYFLWMASLSDKMQWVVIIGIFVGQRILRGISETAPEARPFVIPIIFLLAVFIYLTWAADPLFTLTLFLHPLGRHALKKSERIEAIAVGLCMLAALALVAVFFLAPSAKLLGGALACALLVIPISGTANLKAGPTQYFFMAVTGVLVILTALGTFMPGEGSLVYFSPVFISIFVLSIVLSIIRQQQA